MPGGKGMMTKMAKRFLRSQWAEGISELIAAVEHDLSASVADLVAALDYPEQHLDVPDSDQRAEQLREGVLAIIEDNLQEHFIAEYLDVAKPDRVAQLAALDEADWQARRDGWVAEYQEKGADLDPDEIVEKHLTRHYNLSPDELEELRDWDDDQQTEAMRTVLVGNVEEARNAIEAVTEEVANGA